MKKKLVVFTGSGISAESGIRTFRDSGGLWETYRIEEVATPEAFNRNPRLVNTFYNDRRKQVIEAQPNAAHLALTALESNYDVTIITQNIDDLHERAGSANVMHLHGEIRKCRSVSDPDEIYDIEGWELPADAKSPGGSSLRPHIVWFGEMVPMMEHAALCFNECDLLIIVGTSLEVYPAAGLVHAAADMIPKYFIDPQATSIHQIHNLTCIAEKATTGVPSLVERLLKTT